MTFTLPIDLDHSSESPIGIPARGGGRMITQTALDRKMNL